MGRPMACTSVSILLNRRVVRPSLRRISSTMRSYWGEPVSAYFSRLRFSSPSKSLMMRRVISSISLFDAVNHPNYRWLCDIGNFGGVDEDCATAVSKLLPFLTHVHAKDSFRRSGMMPNPGRGWNRTRGGNYRRPTICGHGDVPVQQILENIAATGYDGYVSLEFEGIEDVLTAVEISVENLKRMLGK